LPRSVLLLSILASNHALAVDVDYARDIKPLLSKKCQACHGPLKQEAGLRLDAGSLVHKGSDEGPVIVPQNGAESRLIAKVSASDPADRMPPEGEGEPLTAEQIALLSAWIDDGAPFPSNEMILEDPRQHWAYLPPQRPAVPQVDDPLWSANPVDAFIATKHRAQGLTPLPEADRLTLLRRVYLDLIGLPPTREEQYAFLADTSPTAYERVVDRLLDSPQYGERWGRHWMDVWRYSDWDGYGNELRGSQRHLWRWRDWIVESLNADKPYDRMVLEMLAGDELAPADPDVLRATGFLARQHYKLNRDLWLDNTVEHTFKAFLGITLNCAKCHDHKYDPIEQQEYYQARAVFEPYKVRIDRLPGIPNVEQDGLTRAYDAEPAAQTFVYLRGNEKQPDKEHPVAAAVPAVFDRELSPQEVPLPTDAWYPDLRPHVVEESLAAARGEIDKARAALDKARGDRDAASERLAKLTAKAAGDTPSAARPAVEPLLHDAFAQAQPDLWTMGEGEWTYAEGRLRQEKVALTHCEIVAKQPLPRDFVARFRFRILGGTTYHSVGLSFDGGDDGHSDGVYLSAHPPGPKVQIVHQRAETAYPQTGMKPLPIELNREYLLEVAVRDRLLNVSVDGKLVLAYRLPYERRPGRFSLWAFDTSADFLEAEVAALPENALLVEQVGESAPATPEEARFAVAAADGDVVLAEKKVVAAEAALDSMTARVAADQAKVSESGAGMIDELSQAAASAERRHKLLKTEIALLEAEQKVVVARNSMKPEDAKSKEALTKVEKELEEARKEHSEAEAALDKTDGEYTPFGTQYPQSSTGRRLALARWIVARDNPLAARVAVNHIWLRHFGTPLVTETFDFGLRSPAPVHQDLLDWLAVELMESGWSMKHLHRLIVTSRTYRGESGESRVETGGSRVAGQESRVGEQHGETTVGHSQLSTLNSQLDKDNLYYWRANVRRLDAEVVRDSVLYVGGALDLTRGGPDIDFAEGEKVPRRSLYFRHAYEKQMRFLVLFDEASPNECYRRTESIVPQQALALANSALSLGQSRKLARTLSETLKDAADGDGAIVTAAFERVLCRPPLEAELAACREFLMQQREQLADAKSLSGFEGETTAAVPPSDDPALRARENLVHVLMNHNDFVTVR
jgi:hypothetical protein